MILFRAMLRPVAQKNATIFVYVQCSPPTHPHMLHVPACNLADIIWRNNIYICILLFLPRSSQIALDQFSSFIFSSFFLSVSSAPFDILARCTISPDSPDDNKFHIKLYSLEIFACPVGFRHFSNNFDCTLRRISRKICN